MSYDVVIIGAGLAGIAAARRLLAAGVENFVVVEAGAAPGGRVRTLNDDNGTFELGAQWLHGTESKLYKIAVEEDLVSDISSEEGVGMFVRNDGLVIEKSLVSRVDFQIGKILANAEKFVEEQSSDCPNSLGEYLDEQFESYLRSYNKSEKELLRELLDWHKRFQQIDNSCGDLRWLSARAWGRYDAPDGQKHINIKGGFSKLISALLKSVPTSHFVYNFPVQSVECDSDIFKIYTDVNEQPVKTKHVICTVSLGVLKSNSIKFKNIFDGSFIQNLGYGAMGKVILVFAEPFWGNEKGFQFVWKAEAKWNKWTRFLSGFEVVLDQKNVLIGWVAQGGVEEMEALSPDAVWWDCVEVLEMFLMRRITPITKIYKTSWLSDQNFCGTYSYIHTKCDDNSALARPYLLNNNKNVFVFAGEACHPTHFSTAHGAFESGESQTEQLLNYLVIH